MCDLHFSAQRSHVGEGGHQTLVHLDAPQKHLLVQVLVVIVKQDGGEVHRRETDGRKTHLQNTQFTVAHIFRYILDYGSGSSFLQTEVKHLLPSWSDCLWQQGRFPFSESRSCHETDRVTYTCSTEKHTCSQASVCLAHMAVQVELNACHQGSLSSVDVKFWSMCFWREEEKNNRYETKSCGQTAFFLHAYIHTYIYTYMLLYISKIGLSIWRDYLIN